MPTKRNKAGNQQNYVPAGHGDASGEYGDNATGSNKHIQFTSFKKPQEQSKKLRERRKQGFRYNKFYKKWDAISDEEYNRYKKLKEQGYVSDLQLKQEDIGILSQEERKEIQDKAVSRLEKEIDNANIDNIKDYMNDFSDAYKNAFEQAVGNYSLNEAEKDFALSPQERKTYFPNEVAIKLEEKAKEKGLELAKEYVDKNFSKIKGEHSIEEDLKKVNPNYNKGGAYRINCQRCSFAYELRRRGYDVEANPNNNGFDISVRWKTQMDFKEQYTFQNKKGIKKLVTDISEKVKNAGDGSRWAVQVQWSRSSNGHLFIAENVGGEVKFFDAQNGEQKAISYFNHIAKTKETSIYRMDNAQFNYGVKETGFTPK